MGDLVGEIEDASIMRHNDDRAVGANSCRTQQFHDCMTGPSVKGRSRLVADNQPRLVNQRSGQRDSLLFPARKLRRQRVGTMGHPQSSQELFASRDCLLPFNATGQ